MTEYGATGFDTEARARDNFVRERLYNERLEWVKVHYFRTPMGWTWYANTEDPDYCPPGLPGS